MTRQLAIIGASVRAAAFSMLRANITPLAADLFADVDLNRYASAHRARTYPRGLADWLQTTPPGTPWMYTGALENYGELVDEMAEMRPLLGCCGATLRQVRDPLRLSGALNAAGLRFPETHAFIECPAEESAWLVKTYRGSSGMGVCVLDGQNYTRSESQSAYLQRRVEGVPGSAIFVASRGNARSLGITRQLVGLDWTHARAFQYAGSLGPWQIGESAEMELGRAGDSVAGLGVSGLFGIDFVLDAGGEVWVVEVNPRYTASVEIAEWVTGDLAMAAHIAAAEGEALPQPIRARAETSSYFGKAILFAPCDLTVTPAFAEWILEQSGTLWWPRFADLPHAETRIAKGQPVLTVFAHGASLDHAERRLRRRVTEVENRLLQDALQGA